MRSAASSALPQHEPQNHSSASSRQPGEGRARALCRGADRRAQQCRQNSCSGACVSTTQDKRTQGALYEKLINTFKLFELLHNLVIMARKAGTAHRWHDGCRNLRVRARVSMRSSGQVLGFISAGWRASVRVRLWYFRSAWRDFRSGKGVLPLCSSS
jgi:hypothetical protein